MTFQASPQQAAYFDWIQNGSGSCVLEAVAGSGKTTTLIQGLKLMKGKIFFGAYNKKIAEEIKGKAPQLPNLTVSTMHAAGFGAWRRAAPNVKVDDHKVRDIWRNRVADKPQYQPYEGAVTNLVSLAKQAGLGTPIRSLEEYDAWLRLVEHFDVEIPDGQERLVVSLAKRLLTLSLERDTETIDFDDMIYAPLAHKVSTNQYDWVLIDEAQDTNATRRALALLMLKRGGRLVAVGDRHQAIYGFTGADDKALDLIGESVTAKQLPLTVTYRCPKAVVKEAQKYVSHIQAHESAPDGTVRGLGETETLVTAAKPGDAVLCRFNKPIVETAYAFISAGVPAKVEGREIGNGLKTLARRWKSKTYGDLLEKLAAYEEREVSKFRAKEEESKAAGVEDKVACLKILVERAMRTDPNSRTPVDSVCAIIDDLFGDNVGKEAVLLSTIHKSKGREWNKVFWLQTGPSKWARKAWELEQEKNLCYVAVTRAKQELVLA